MQVMNAIWMMVQKGNSLSYLQGVCPKIEDVEKGKLCVMVQICMKSQFDM